MGRLPLLGKVGRLRSLLVLLAGIGGFLALSLHTHRVSSNIEESESKVPERIRAYARQGAELDVEEDGYRYAWDRSVKGVDILVARPVELGRTGARAFATPDGVHVFEFDPTLFTAPPEGPPVAPLRRYFALPKERLEKTDPPVGWKPVP